MVHGGWTLLRPFALHSPDSGDRNDGHWCGDSLPQILTESRLQLPLNIHAPIHHGHQPSRIHLQSTRLVAGNLPSLHFCGKMALCDHWSWNYGMGILGSFTVYGYVCVDASGLCEADTNVMERRRWSVKFLRRKSGCRMIWFQKCI